MAITMKMKIATEMSIDECSLVPVQLTLVAGRHYNPTFLLKTAQKPGCPTLLGGTSCSPCIAVPSTVSASRNPIPKHRPSTLNPKPGTLAVEPVQNHYEARVRTLSGTLKHPGINRFLSETLNGSLKVILALKEPSKRNLTGILKGTLKDIKKRGLYMAEG